MIEKNMIKEWLERYHPEKRDGAKDTLRESCKKLLLKYQEAIINEFAALGMQVSISEKQKTVKSNINSVFLNSETIRKELVLKGVIPQNGLNEVVSIKVKIEVDKEPPFEFFAEERLILQPLFASSIFPPLPELIHSQ